MIRDSIRLAVIELCATCAGWQREFYRVEKIGDLTILHTTKNPITAKEFLLNDKQNKNHNKSKIL